MEALDQSKHAVTFLITCRGIGKSYQTDWVERNDREIILSGFTSPLRVLSGEHRYPSWLGRFRSTLTTLRHLWQIWKTVKNTSPDFVYVDRSNVIGGALIARLHGVPVVLRVMGVYPSMWDIVSEKPIGHKIARWAYRTPFSAVVCTQDGSGGERWLPHVLSPKTPFHMLLNGFDGAKRSTSIDPQVENIPTNCTIVLFVGRFESIKGCEQFADAVLLALRRGAKNIHAVMVGTGSLYHTVRENVNRADANETFTFITRLPHHQVPEVFRRSDIYVSLNRLGQLSNANLEAMSMGTCMIIPEAQPEKGIDVPTTDIINSTAAIRIPWESQVDALAEAILSLLNNPSQRHTLSKNIKAVANKVICPWDDRIQEEFSIISEHIGKSI